MRAICTVCGETLNHDHKPPTDEEFFKAYIEALEYAKEAVISHTRDGENEYTSIVKMFPHGVQDLLFVVYTKACRALGYEKRGMVEKVLEEMRDIVNYAAFAEVFAFSAIIKGLRDRGASWMQEKEAPDGPLP